MSAPDGSGNTAPPIQVDVQAQIDAAVKAALAAQQAAQIEAAKPRELTPEEKIADSLDRAYAALTQDRVSTHDACLLLVEAVRGVLALKGGAN